MEKQFTFPFNFEMLNDERYKDVYMKVGENEYLVTDIILNRDLEVLKYSINKQGVKITTEINIPLFELPGNSNQDIEQRCLHFAQKFLYHKTEKKHEAMIDGNGCVSSYDLLSDEFFADIRKQSSQILLDYLDKNKDETTE